MMHPHPFNPLIILEIKEPFSNRRKLITEDGKQIITEEGSDIVTEQN